MNNVSLHDGSSSAIERYNEAHGLGHLVVVPAQLADLKAEVTDLHYNMLDGWQPAELARTHLDL